MSGAAGAGASGAAPAGESGAARAGGSASACAAPRGHGLLAGRRAIVTGGSRGIGAGIAETLAREGAAVGLIGRDAAALTQVAGRLRVRAGAEVEIRAADLAGGDEVAAAVDELAGALGGVDLLVNNAGTTVREDALALSADDWDRVLAVNLRAAFVASQAAARAMVAGGTGGAIVNIASLSAHFGIRRAPAYAASKGGIVQLTKALALEWGVHGIRVNAVAPGYVATELTRPLTDDAERREAISRRIPLGRWGSPEDVGGAVALLCSPLAGYVTGQVLYADGGYATDG
ncbi:SDR family NAD(P)-dependent oxidoreductase [Conexibacter arvalis]|uniref:2-deoxy-D-gluconate 3-dehydrogenase n=1 Tax=Conexibacter arvalis TaxID=912552 RepID=A0A840ID14_9ACTN|nr:glucose 1-dehydrogenase [Conexibacter arvalis]MBB4661830.1 2-deoxy-D-gluconate 3-dehydrogenase [Conexibacter arvalis]